MRDGKRVWKYTMADVAEASGLSLNAVRDRARNGFHPDNLKSVAMMIVSEVLKDESGHSHNGKQTRPAKRKSQKAVCFDRKPVPDGPTGCVVRNAGLSVGNLYARYQGKE